MDEIVPGVFLTDWTRAATAHQSLAHLNCAEDVVYVTGSKSMHLPLMDESEYNGVLLEVADDAADFIHNNKPVVVYCMLGRSRSASIMACYLMRYHGMGYATAISAIRAKRPQAFFFGRKYMFEDAMRKYEAILDNFRSGFT